MKFQYKARSESGEETEGVIDAATKIDLGKELKAEGKTLVYANPYVEKKFSLDFRRLNEIFSSVSLHEKITFAKNLSAMVQAGLPLARAFETLGRQTKNPKFKRILTAMTEGIKRGDSLSAGLAEYPDVFPPIFVAVVRVGEESGGLTDSLNTVGEQLEKTYELRKKVRGAMIYPMIVIFAMIIIGALMLVYVVPTLTSVFEELAVDLPASTQFIIGASKFLVENTISALGIFIAIIAGFVLFRKTRFGKRSFDFLFLHAPIFSKLVKRTNTAYTARTVSSLLAAGIDIVEALTITRDVLQNSFYKNVMTSAIERVQKGETLSSILTQYEHLYEPLAIEMVEVGEETGLLSDMLKKVADFYEAEVSAATKDMATVIEPFLMLLIGGGVGFFAVSMISPMYSLTSNI
ncbi:type II secretion system F family protein [bacterium]|nr:type II secretion system F family protein [bacterium]